LNEKFQPGGRPAKLKDEVSLALATLQTQSKIEISWTGTIFSPFFVYFNT